MRAKQKLYLFVKGFSSLTLLLTFFYNYLLLGTELKAAFVHSVITYIVTYFALKVVIFIWRSAFSVEEWHLIIEGKIDRES